MRKKLAAGITILVAIVLGVTLLSACQSAGGDTVSRQLVPVTREDIQLSVTGSGKIETPREARLSFTSGGKVAEINVVEGDHVAAGDVLASLDTRPLELAVDQAKFGLTQAQGAMAQANLALSTASYNLKNTQDTKEALDLAVLNAEIALDAARNTLNAGISAVDFDAATAELNKARAWYDYVERQVEEGTTPIDSWLLALDQAKDRLDLAQSNYDNALAGYDSNQVNLLKKRVEAAELAVDQAKQNRDGLDDDIAIQQQQVSYAEKTVIQATDSVDLARKALEDAERQLQEATIIAPFDGVVAAVNAEEGDIVPSPTMAPMTLINVVDPNYLELVVEIDEIDIPLVRVGQKTSIEVDALPGDEFTGTVTAVYPVPVEVAGVTLYKTKVALDVPENSGIMVGMNASATIVSEKHENVLVVPSRAVTTDSQGNSVVRVMNGDQEQERQVVVGLDDGLRAEIVSGLNEGDSVVVEVRLKTPSTSFF